MMTARSAIASEHVTLVHHVAHQLGRYLSDEVTHEELVSAGALGLLAAERSFDASRGLKFSTYAVPRIRGAMLDDLRRQDVATKSTRRRARLLDSVRAQLGNSLGRRPTQGDIANGIGISAATLARWELAIKRAKRVPIEHILAHEERKFGRPMETGLAPDETLTQDIAQAENRQFLQYALAQLPVQQREILARYYWRGENIGAIARELGLTESRISQVKATALKALREHFAAAA